MQLIAQVDGQIPLKYKNQTAMLYIRSLQLNKCTTHHATHRVRELTWRDIPMEPKHEIMYGYIIDDYLDDKLTLQQKVNWLYCAYKFRNDAEALDAITEAYLKLHPRESPEEK